MDFYLYMFSILEFYRSFPSDRKQRQLGTVRSIKADYLFFLAAGHNQEVESLSAGHLSSLVTTEVVVVINVTLDSQEQVPK